MGILSTVPQSFWISSCRCLTVLAQDASATFIYSFIAARPADCPIPWTLVVTHSFDAEPTWVEWKTAMKNMIPAAAHSMCVTRLGLLKRSGVFMTAMLNNESAAGTLRERERRGGRGKWDGMGRRT